MTLGDRIRQAREAADMSQEALADAVGVAARTVGNWERDTVKPRSKIGAVERVLAVQLRPVSGSEQGVVGLEEASDAQLLAQLDATRLPEQMWAARRREPPADEPEDERQ